MVAPSPEEQRLTDLYRRKGLAAVVEELNNADADARPGAGHADVMLGHRAAVGAVGCDRVRVRSVHGRFVLLTLRKDDGSHGWPPFSARVHSMGNLPPRPSFQTV